MREMKDSGVEWIGEIPAHWEPIRFRFIAKITTGNQDTQNADPDGEYPFYVRSPIVERCNSYTFDGEGILMAGDGAGAGRVFHLVDGKYAVHQRVYRFYDFKYMKPVLLKYYLENLFATVMDYGSAKTTVPSVRLPMIQDFVVCVPPEAEQMDIMDVLSSKCSQVDALIANVQTQIEKLKAYKQSLITEVVTKGLDPTVPMKDSGVESVGIVPEHWEICRVRNIGAPQNGISKGGEFFGEGFPFVTYGDVYRNFSLPENPSGLIQSTPEEQDNYSVCEGDIFFTRTSETIEEVGFSCVCEKTIPNATFAGFLIRVRPYNNALTTPYAKYYFRSNHLRLFLSKEMNIVTRASLGQNLLKNIPVLLPPTEEQVKIAEELDLRCNQIDQLISIKQKKIDKLNEYKKSLIYEYVTGKQEVM